MEPLLKEVLVTAGVDLTSSEKPILETWNDWIYGNEGASLETMAPLSEQVYEAFCSLFIHAWRNVIQLERSDTTSTDTLLASQVEAIQVTQWLRDIMDLHVDSEATFSALLLSTPQSEALLQALFHHLASLPQIQQEIHFIIQQQRQQSTPLLSQTSVQTRLEHYQATQQYSELLLNELDQHIDRLEYVLGEWYSVGSVETRKSLRTLLGTLWHDFATKTSLRPSSSKIENTSACGLDMTLRVLQRILQGSSSLTLPSYKHLLFHQLLPLHTPNNMLLWRDQTCLLDLYHESLVKCVCILLQQQPEWLPSVVEELLSSQIWPSAGGNTPKIILLLHEIDTLISLTSVDVWNCHQQTFSSLILRLATCASSDNSRTAERALQYFRNTVFEKLVWNHYDVCCEIFLKALIKTEVPWNPTVRKMTHHVLSQLQEHDEIKFAAAAIKVFGSSESVVSTTLPQTQETVNATKLTSPKEATDSKATTATRHSTPQPPSNRFSLKAGMGSWRPPRTSAPAHAKYAMGPPKSRPPRNNAKGAAPPLTITGVAPWATESHKRNAVEAHLPDIASSTPSTIVEEEEDEEDQEEPGLKRVLSYMNQLKPPSSDDDDDGTSPWARAQMAESPTLLPSLKFHDLVFGHDLGKGAFGIVRYARQISKTTTRSHWAEYAVKIISTTKILEEGYEASVQREIAILCKMSHPCIARLVSAFRFRDGAYLVLEYASGGDLFTLLQKKGSLDQESTRFVIGEVASALASIHELGFVYADLKPENVLITETGHIKLTDFGGCRPLTNAARDLIRPSGKHFLKELRDGDWKEKPKNGSDDDNDEVMEDTTDMQVEEMDEDVRIEGTTAYLPPEVVMGESPTAAADSWALGCVMYQCLSGRPPLLDNDDHATKQKIVTFHVEQGHKEEEEDSDPLFRDSHGADIPPEARLLIRKLLSPQQERLSMAQVAEDPFFAGTNIFALHRQPAVPLDVGTVAPVQDATWSRRQFSSIWAPQPKAYDISMPQEHEIAVNPRLASKAPIPEGEEASAFFSWKSR